MKDIHNYKRRFDRTLERINDLKVPKKTKAIILKFKDSCILQGISYGKIDAYLFYLMKIVEIIKKPLEKANKRDIEKIVAEISQREYSEETKVSIKIVLRKLYKMIRGTEGKGEYPKEVKWISTSIPRNKRKVPEELLNEEETKLLIKFAPTLRDKAFISVLAESGCRIGEIGSMQIKHISFEEYGARLTVTGKTGPRKILVINCTPYLQQWINEHPLNDNPEAYLWYNPRDQQNLSYTRLSEIIRLSGKRAGITKRIFPHLLRHTQATYMASIMTESAMKQYFGWTQDSKMAGVYVHMSGKDTDEAVLRANGIEIEKKKIERKLSAIRCLRCKKVNEATARICNSCGLPLCKEEAEKILIEDTKRQRVEEVMQKIVADKDILELINKKFG